MEPITIHFNNSVYKGTLFSSREERPFFYWCYLEDNELIKKVGDCIGFTEKSGELVPTHRVSKEYLVVVNEVKQYIVDLYYKHCTLPA
jgi:hypothetical protein